MNDYPETVTGPSSPASVVASIALFAAGAVFLLVTGAGLSLGALPSDRGERIVSSPPAQPLCGISNGSPGKP